ncbi:DNA polymerase family A-domain-containing protein [Lineolata rhizophorae]|uniref:DNA-directed DNA polymerase n=1 Tax=Lineolata rhizophorae TaxID=578093 RepID=A0A6A6NNN5_9PEZI|nr:DNA polymerase family A-domain-containing protein [Lineolata rhizophorae]
MRACRRLATASSAALALAPHSHPNLGQWRATLPAGVGCGGSVAIARTRRQRRWYAVEAGAAAAAKTAEDNGDDGYGSNGGGGARSMSSGAEDSSSRSSGCSDDTLAVPSIPRFSPLGIQHLSAHLHTQLTPATPSDPPSPALLALSKDHLIRHSLLGANPTPASPTSFDLPPLAGATLDEHFHRLGRSASEPFLTLASRFALLGNTPPRPRKWVAQAGWTKYFADGRTEPVAAPDEDALAFDTEVLYKETPFACMAVACGAHHWYAWLSPWLLGESVSDRHLIPLGDPATPRVVVGHNVGYDRARVAEEYALDRSETFFLDTMSLHVAVNGMCSRQRPTWERHRKSRELRDKVAASASGGGDLAALLDARRDAGGSSALGLPDEEEEELWVARSSVNSLRDVARFHCGIALDKGARAAFGTLDRAGVRARLPDLLDYCAADVAVTHAVFRKVFPAFVQTCPHPVSFAALRDLGALVLPVDEGWGEYVRRAEETYARMSEGVTARLVGLAERALEVKDKAEVYGADPWLRQLDWSGQEVKMVKGKKKGEGSRPAARQKKPGMPRWYKDLFATSAAPINLTVRSRVAPLLLRLSWDGYPLVWSDRHGWTFCVGPDKAAEAVRKYEGSSALVRCDMRGYASDGDGKVTETDERLRKDALRGCEFFKIPHRDGPSARCATPLAKTYLGYFEKGVLGSEYGLAREALEMNASCSYWISARERIRGQMVVWEDEVRGKQEGESSASSEEPTVADETDAPSRQPRQGFILPQVIPMGTITRRAVENTWLTASNAKPNRVGSELKSMVTAPPGYAFVGADVDSQELWIASLVGDSQFGLHGGSALGFMTLEGSKAAGTDLHSRTAGILGIGRNDAKVFNYGRIYGAGAKFASTLLRQFNPELSDEQAERTAQELYRATKGTKTTRRALRPRPFWRGGSESTVFNALEDFAEQVAPRTPVLGAGITEALLRHNVARGGGGGFLPSRVNWAIQSSGVDYLHLLIVGMNHLCSAHGIRARLALTVHDEIRYLVKDEDKWRAALALQVANLWTRALFAERLLGTPDLPQAVAFFSAVDVDSVLRKEVDLECVTPSHPEPIPPGERVDIDGLLAMGRQASLGPVRPEAGPRLDKLRTWPYEPRESIVAALRREMGLAGEAKRVLDLRAQIAQGEDELRGLVREAKAAAAGKDVGALVKGLGGGGDGAAGGEGERKAKGRKKGAAGASTAGKAGKADAAGSAAKQPSPSPSSSSSPSPRKSPRSKAPGPALGTRGLAAPSPGLPLRHGSCARTTLDALPVDSWDGSAFFRDWEAANGAVVMRGVRGAREKYARWGGGGTGAGAGAGGWGRSSRV